MDFDWKKLAYCDATNSFAYWNLYIEIICNVFLICLFDISRSFVAQKSPWPCNFWNWYFAWRIIGAWLAAAIKVARGDYWDVRILCHPRNWHINVKNCNSCGISLSLNNWRYLFNLQTHNCWFFQAATSDQASAQFLFRNTFLFQSLLVFKHNSYLTAHSSQSSKSCGTVPVLRHYYLLASGNLHRFACSP